MTVCVAAAAAVSSTQELHGRVSALQINLAGKSTMLHQAQQELQQLHQAQQELRQPQGADKVRFTDVAPSVVACVCFSDSEAVTFCWALVMAYACS
jgi:hypothetical protein